MKNGKLYGVGVGPGDKELITLKALRILKDVDIIAVPCTRNGEKKAYEIVEEYIREKETISFVMPMNKNFDILKENYEKICDLLEEYLKQGKDAAFITLGDPCIYSTYMQINEIIRKRGYETEIVPGVTSFCAAAARLNMPLCEREEPLLIFPASYKEISQGFKINGTKVFMKSGKEFINVRNMLESENLIEDSVMIECCGMKNERIFKDLNEVQENAAYFSIIIVKDKK